VWRDDVVFAIDTKGGHLIAEAVARKLLNIKRPDGAKPKLFVRLISDGTYDTDATQVTKEGFTVWGTRHDGARKVTNVADIDEVVASVLTA
jgi:type III restriction enzyme